MSETATVEAINGEQIATVTDLLLLRARTTRRRFSTNKLAFAHDRRGSRPSIPLPVVPAPAEDDFRDPERTLFVRARTFGTSTASAAIVATVFAIGIVVTSFL
jgi:hypothetical protein